MSSLLHTIPSGATEYRTQDLSPVVGRSLERNGAIWIVLQVKPLVDGSVEVTRGPGPDPVPLETVA